MSERHLAAAPTDDTKVFDAIADARRQYEDYLRIAQAAAEVAVWTESLALPEAPDLPLSLHISEQ